MSINVMALWDKISWVSGICRTPIMVSGQVSETSLVIYGTFCFSEIVSAAQGGYLVGSMIDFAAIWYKMYCWLCVYIYINYNPMYNHQRSFKRMTPYDPKTTGMFHQSRFASSPTSNLRSLHFHRIVWWNFSDQETADSVWMFLVTTWIHKNGQ